MDLNKRFWSKVLMSDGCWLWQSAIGSRGYGIFWIGGKQRNEMAHRMAFLLTAGHIPPGMVVMHSCDTPACVNPAHLSLGTVRMNALDAKAKGRLAYGERNGGGRKLTVGDVREIRNTPGTAELARRFKVSTQTIKAIRRRAIWRSVE